MAPVVVAEAAIVVKRFPRTHPVATNAVGMLVGAALLAAGSLAAGEPWTLPREAATWAAAAWLVVAAREDESPFGERAPRERPGRA